MMEAAIAYRLDAPEFMVPIRLLQMTAISKRFPGVVALDGVIHQELEAPRVEAFYRTL